MLARSHPPQSVTFLLDVTALALRKDSLDKFLDRNVIHGIGVHVSAQLIQILRLKDTKNNSEDLEVKTAIATNQV